jgi:hypothetical protein
MNPIISTKPDCMIGLQVIGPEPVTKLTTPRGNEEAKAVAVSKWASPPILGSFITTTFPMQVASVVYYVCFHIYVCILLLSSGSKH